MDIYSRVKTAISASRLEVYRLVGDGDLEVLAKYLWNVALCESFYPTLQTLEVGLRNRLHGVLTIHHRTEYWFDQCPTFLDSERWLSSSRPKRFSDIEERRRIPTGLLRNLISDFGPVCWTADTNRSFGQSCSKRPFLTCHAPCVLDEICRAVSIKSANFAIESFTMSESCKEMI